MRFSATVCTMQYSDERIMMGFFVLSSTRVAATVALCNRRNRLALSSALPLATCARATARPVELQYRSFTLPSLEPLYYAFELLHLEHGTRLLAALRFFADHRWSDAAGVCAKSQHARRPISPGAASLREKLQPRVPK